MSLLFFFIILSIGVSFLCSLLEAVILSVTPSYLVSLEQKKPKLFKSVKYLKDDIERPLASILTFNTVAHTIGAAGAGAEAQRLFGSETLAVFSAILTLAILFFSEIIPKSIGANSWKALLPFSAAVLRPMMLASFPLVLLSEMVSGFFKKDQESVSKEEIEAMADIGLDAGALKKDEHRSLKSLIRFEHVKAAEILTPFEKVSVLKDNDAVEQAYKSIQQHTFSRIPVVDASSQTFVGYVLRTRLLEVFIQDSSKSLRELVSPLLILEQSISLPDLFQKLLVRREHICAIVDERQQPVGVITLEDLIEHMLDLEIYDEQDE